MAWTTRYVPFDESGYAAINALRFPRTPASTYSSGEGMVANPASWGSGSPADLYPQLRDAVSQYDSAYQTAEDQYNASFNDGTSNAFGGIGAPDFYQQLAASGMTPEQFIEDWRATYPQDQLNHAPQVVMGADGKKYLKYDSEHDKGGLLDKITGFVEPALAWSGLGASALGAEIAGGAAAGAGGVGAAEGLGLPSVWGSSLPFGSAELGIVGTAGAGGGLISGLTQQEALTYVQGATDGIDAISRLAEISGGSADAGAKALGFATADTALQNLVPTLLNAAVNGVPTTTPTTPTTPPTPPKPPGSVTDGIKTVSNVVGAATGLGAIAGAANTDTSDPYASIRADEEARQNRIRSSVGDIRSQFGRFDDNYLNGISRSYLDYYLPQFNEQATDARRNLIFSTPAAGTSAFARRSGKLETDIGRQESNIRSQADQQAQSQKAKLANTEETLIAQAEGAGGIADAASRAASMADIASKPEPYSPLGQLFAAYTGNVANAAQAERLGYKPTGIVPNIFSRPGGRSPIVYN